MPKRWQDSRERFVEAVCRYITIAIDSNVYSRFLNVKKKIDYKNKTHKHDTNKISWYGMIKTTLICLIEPKLASKGFRA